MHQVRIIRWEGVRWDDACGHLGGQLLRGEARPGPQRLSRKTALAEITYVHLPYPVNVSWGSRKQNPMQKIYLFSATDY